MAPQSVARNAPAVVSLHDATSLGRVESLKGGCRRWHTPPVELVAINVEETLYVSGEIEDWQALASAGIDTVVDMDASVDAGLPQAPGSILYVYHPILDEDLPNLGKIDALGRLVADLVSSDHRVLVHCRMGFNRSVLVIATALTYLGMTGEAALNHLRERRPGALFNETFATHVATLPARRIRVDTL
jgi:protein-tyrosine phosphatase